MNKNAEPFKSVAEQLESDYGDAGRQAADRLAVWLSGKIPHAYPEILEKHLTPAHVPLLFDAFWQVLPFGTGGRRGSVGYGANRLNPTTVAMTVQGHCNYLKATYPDREDLTVVVANDVRVFQDLGKAYTFLGENHPLLGVSSRSLGRLACEIYAANGVTAYFPEPEADQAVLTTPELSFAIHQLHALGGINLSASHNPPDDNGVKVFDGFGSQPIAPNDQHLIDAMEKASDVQSMPFDQALSEGRIKAIPASFKQDYLKAYVQLFDGIHQPDPNIPITYTPLCGCGGNTVRAVLLELGYPLIEPKDQGPDGSFAVIPLRAPNPEVPQATEPTRQLAEQHHSTVVLSSDPDADRVGLEVRLEDGSWYHFDGNQIAAILCYFLMLDPKGPKRRGLVIETLVTTKILGGIVKAAGDSWIVDNLLVGFKYVAEVLKRLEKEGNYESVTCSPKQLVLAAEESHGVLMIPYIRDKDAAPACMYLAALHQRLTAEGTNLRDYYINILETLGGYDCFNRSIMMTGASGVKKRDRIMQALRDNPPRTIADRDVLKIEDHWDESAFGPFVSASDKLPRNVIQIETERCVVTVRPSGTEPKLKLYCQLLPTGKPTGTRGLELLKEVRKETQAMAGIVYREILGLLDMQLGEVGLLLPDIVDVDSKIAFETRTLTALKDALVDGTHDSLDSVLDWLRGEVASMARGSDPLPAIKRALAHQCEAWKSEIPAAPLLGPLHEWAAD